MLNIEIIKKNVMQSYSSLIKFIIYSYLMINNILIRFYSYHIVMQIESTKHDNKNKALCQHRKQILVTYLQNRIRIVIAT